MKEKGQIVIILLLVMVVTLAIALALAGRSNNEIAVSTKTESSSRAFSAAEAAIEKALNQNLSSGRISVNTLTNQSAADVDAFNIPSSTTAPAIEYPPFGKESTAQFWLADPADLTNINGLNYTQSSFEVYFGAKKDYSENNNYSNQPAIEVNVISLSAGSYVSNKYIFDSYGSATGTLPDASRFAAIDGVNIFGCSTSNPSAIQTNNSGGNNRYFYCQVRVPPSGSLVANPIMARVRMLYVNEAHPVAIKPVGTGSFPSQVMVYKSVGTSGSVQRTLQVFKQKNVMPFFFDYALFSAGQLSK